MACKQIQAMLAPYLEGFVSPEEKRLVEQHLASCDQCKHALADLQKTAGLLRHLEEIEPPPWFTQKVMARVREEAEKKKAGLLERLFVPLRVKVPIQALATALIVVLALYVYRSVEPEMKLAQAPPETARVITKDELRETHDRAGGAVATETKDAPGEQRSEDAGKRVAAPRADSIVTLKKEGAEPAQPQKSFAASPAPVAPPASAGSSPSASTRLGDTREEKALTPARDMKMFTAREAAAVAFTVRVGDVKAAAEDIENLLVRLGGRSITAQLREDKALIAAELPAQKIDDLVKGLNAFGRVIETDARRAVTNGTVPISIEVSARP